MEPKGNNRIATLLRYTYRANMVFFAGFAAWYFLKQPGKEEIKSIAQKERIDVEKGKN